MHVSYTMSSLLNILCPLLHLLITYSLISILGRVWSAGNTWWTGHFTLVHVPYRRTSSFYPEFYVSPYNKQFNAMNTCYDITDNWQLYLIIAECHWSLASALEQNPFAFSLKVVITCLFRTLIVYLRKRRK